MVFSSLLFLFRFLPLALLAYYAAPRKWRNLILFLFSLVFYAWGEPVYVVLILFSTLTDYTAGRIVAYFNGQRNRKCARMAVFFSACVNLALLGFFKYADFFLQTVSSIFSIDIPALELALPIGISFYTFQTMSYTIDVYRGDAKVQKNFIAFGAYVALFPQLIAGPIIRYKTVAEQMDCRRETVDLFFRGIIRFTAGLGKKVLLANQTGMLWSQIAAYSADNLTTAAAWTGIIAFTFQIYFDFSGYSDMAIGLGYLFGFSFTENFDYPYESKSITEFWRRWHISLGTWFKEYVYIPLGGNRKGMARQMCNIGIVWLLTGLWHGAYWNFVLWGVYYGILLVLEKFVWGRVLKRLPAWVSHVYTMLIVMIGWSLFSWQDMRDSAAYMRALFFHASAGIADRQAVYLLLSNALLFLIAAAGSVSLCKRAAVRYLGNGDEVLSGQNGGLKKRGFGKGSWRIRSDAAGIVFMTAVLAASLAMLVNSSYNPFLYFRF